MNSAVAIRLGPFYVVLLNELDGVISSFGAMRPQEGFDMLIMEAPHSSLNDRVYDF